MTTKCAGEDNLAMCQEGNRLRIQLGEITNGSSKKRVSVGQEYRHHLETCPICHEFFVRRWLSRATVSTETPAEVRA